MYHLAHGTDPDSLWLGRRLEVSTSEVIDTLVYQLAFDSGFPQFAPATGLFKGVIGLILLLAVNQLARRLLQTSLF